MNETEKQIRSKLKKGEDNSVPQKFLNKMVKEFSKPKKNKFGAKKTVIDGITFDSKKEAKRYGELKQLMKAKDPKERVIDIFCQWPYEFHLDDEKIFTYKADFVVHYADGRTEYEDVKGLKKGAHYQLFRLKKKLIEAQYGIEIIEI